MYLKISIFILLSSLSIPTFAVQPLYSLKAQGSVTAMFIEGEILYAATDAGCIDVFNWQTKKPLNSITFPKIKDFMGDEIAPKVYSIDKWQNKILSVSQGVHGFRNVFTIEDGKTNLLINAETDKMMIKRAVFINKDQILIATLGNELMLFDLISRKFIYKKQLGTSVFSNIDLNDDRSQVAVVDESGIVHIINVKNGEKLKDLQGRNVDNIYQVKYNNHCILSAGQDRRASVYFSNSNISYYLESSFIIYSVGLSSDGNYGAFSYSENNYIKIFNTNTKAELALLKGQKSTLTQIEFINNDMIISSSEDQQIMIWKWR